MATGAARRASGSIPAGGRGSSSCASATLAGQVLQLPRGATGAGNYAGKRVEVHVALDGSLTAYDGERRLAVMAAAANPRQLRAVHALRVEPSLVPAKATIPWTPPRDHPWKRVTPGSKLEKRLTESLGS